MHTLLSFLSIGVVILGARLTLRLLPHIHSWSLRRSMQLFILAIPLVNIGLGIDGLHHLITSFCLFITPLWDTLFGVLLPLMMGLVILGALCLGTIRLALMASVITRYHPWKSSQFQEHVDSFAHRLHTKKVRVLLCTNERPIAFTYGLLRPTLLLSTWMVTQLDPRELEAVLTHELEHVARRDYVVVWFATVLRDAFFYLPTSREAYRQLQQEKELACDDMVVEVTHRPLALASALTKVWLHAVEEPQLVRFGNVQALTGTNTLIANRIERLLVSPRLTTPFQSSRRTPSSVFALMMLALFLLQGVNTMIMFSLMGCNPISLLQRIFLIMHVI